MNLTQHPEALVPLARIATGEVEIPNLDVSVARHLGYSWRLEALPYLATMLESWNSSTRVSAVMGICTLLRPGGKRTAELASLWKETMTAYCPTRSPMASASEETGVVEYWKYWWESQRAHIATLGPLPQVNVPARYRSAPVSEVRMERVEIPIEQRFRSVTMMTVNMAKSGNSLFRSRLSQADDQALMRVATETERKLQDVWAATKKTMDEARASGRMPSQELALQTNERMNSILREALDQARRELSGDGWRALEKLMTEEMNISGTRTLLTK